MWVTSRTGSMGWGLRKVSWLSLAVRRRRRVTFASSPWPCGGCHTWFGADGKVSIEKWYLSPYVEKPLNSKVIKSFVTELRSHQVFLCFRIPMCVMDIMNVLCTGMNMSVSLIHVWLCYTDSLHPYHPSFPAGPPNYILCLHRADVNKFLLVSQHWHIHEQGSIEECY